MADRIVQASLKLVLEPIFEADFHPSSYGFRPRRRAQDAIAEIHKFTSRPADYEWVFEADTRARPTGRTALMGRVRERVGDKRILALIRGLSEAGVLSEDGAGREDPDRHPARWDLVSALLANIVLSVLDWHFQRKWDALGPDWKRAKHRRRGGAVMKMIRLRRRLRRPRPRDARRCLGAAGGGRPGPGPDGTETVGGQDETDPHRGRVRYSSGGASSAARRREPAGRPGPCTYPSKKSLASIIDRIRILTRRTAHRTLADLLRRPGPDGSEAGAPISSTGSPSARSATSTTSPSGEYSAGSTSATPA